MPVILGENAEVVVATAGGWLRLLYWRFLLANQEIRDLRVCVAGGSMVGDGAIKLQHALPGWWRGCMN